MMHLYRMKVKEILFWENDSVILLTCCHLISHVYMKISQNYCKKSEDNE